jgi:hypothetical protein
MRLEKFVAIAFAVIAVGCASGQRDSGYTSSRFDEIAIAARYAARCRVHESDVYARIEIVNYEAGLYFAALFPVREEGGEIRVLSQHGCDASLVASVVAAGDLEVLLLRSTDLQGEFFVGRSYYDGTTYFVRSDAAGVDFAAYEPNNGSIGFESTDLERLRDWARYSEEIRSMGAAE